MKILEKLPGFHRSEPTELMQPIDGIIVAEDQVAVDGIRQASNPTEAEPQRIPWGQHLESKTDRLVETFKRHGR